jgi:small-conductance mechanosensitive channel
MVKLFGLWDIDLPDPINNQWGEFGIALMLWIVLGLAVVVIVRPIIHRIFKETETDVDDQILKIIDVPLVAFIFFYGFIQSMQLVDDIPDWFRENLLTLYGFLITLFVVYIAYKVFKTVFIPLGKEAAEKTESTLDDVLIPLIDKIGGAIILIIGIFWILGTLGVDITVFLAGFLTAGFVLAFALQDTLSNFFSGIFILLDRPFKNGDTILIDGDYCNVEKIGLRSTKLYNRFDHDLVIFPNKTLANSKIVNLTEPDQKFKVRVAVGVAYGSDVDKVQKIMITALENQEGVILDDPNREAFCRFQNVGDSSLDFKATAWVHDIFDQWKIAHNARLEIEKRFNEEGIEVPFPQRVVHMMEAKGP